MPAKKTTAKKQAEDKQVAEVEKEEDLLDSALSISCVLTIKTPEGEKTFNTSHCVPDFWEPRNEINSRSVIQMLVQQTMMSPLFNFVNEKLQQIKRNSEHRANQNQNDTLTVPDLSSEFLENDFEDLEDENMN